MVQPFDRGVEAVGVFHDEFAGAQDAEPRPLFVAKLGLNLIQRDRHLAIAGDLPRDQIGDDFFVRRPQGQLHALFCRRDLELDQHVAKRVDAGRSVPRG